MRAFVISIVALAIRCDASQLLLNQLPFDVDWRESLTNCLNKERPAVDSKLSFASSLSELMSIKLCIESKGETRREMSLLSSIKCEAPEKSDEAMSNGDYLQYAGKQGVIPSECIKYTNEQCINQCDSADFLSLPCKYAIQNVEKLSPTGKIMQSILFEGPVIASMDLYADFLSYKGGMYTHQSGDYIGKQSVLLVGYSAIGGENYWHGKNSFGEDWGEEGYFKIPFDHSGISEDVTTFKFKPVQVNYQ